MRILIFTALMMVWSLFGQPGEMARLKIYLAPVPEYAGARWMIYIYKNPEHFPVRPDLAYKKFVFPVRVQQPLVVSLPPGEYAVAAYLDLNGNGKIDRNWLGLPAEPYALSGNPAFHFGPPRFDECKMAVHAPETVLRLRVSR